jgi:hypothetical protein
LKRLGLELDLGGASAEAASATLAEQGRIVDCPIPPQCPEDSGKPASESDDRDAIAAPLRNAFAPATEWIVATGPAQD